MGEGAGSASELIEVGGGRRGGRLRSGLARPKGCSVMYWLVRIQSKTGDGEALLQIGLLGSMSTDSVEGAESRTRPQRFFAHCATSTIGARLCGVLGFSLFDGGRRGGALSDRIIGLFAFGVAGSASADASGGASAGAVAGAVAGTVAGAVAGTKGGVAAGVASGAMTVAKRGTLFAGVQMRVVLKARDFLTGLMGTVSSRSKRNDCCPQEAVSPFSKACAAAAAASSSLRSSIFIPRSKRTKLIKYSSAVLSLERLCWRMRLSDIVISRPAIRITKIAWMAEWSLLSGIQPIARIRSRIEMMKNRTLSFFTIFALSESSESRAETFASKVSLPTSISSSLRV